MVVYDSKRVKLRVEFFDLYPYISKQRMMSIYHNEWIKPDMEILQFCHRIQRNEVSL